jgi:hypothetical protein
MLEANEITVTLQKGGDLDMAILMEMVNARRGDKSFEDYAHEMGLKTSVLYKYITEKGERDMSVPNLQKMAQYYHRIGDAEMVEALASYATGLKVTLSPS